MKKLITILSMLPLAAMCQFSATASIGFHGAFYVNGGVEAGYTPTTCHDCDRLYLGTQVRFYEVLGVSVAPIIGYQMDFGSRVDQTLMPYVKLDNFAMNAKGQRYSEFGGGVRWYQYSGFLEVGFKGNHAIVLVGWTLNKKHRNQ